VTVRDQNSYDLLRNIGVVDQPILITADAALTMRPASEERVQSIMQSLGFNPGEQILGINVSAYLDSWSGAKREPMGKEKFLATYSSALNRVLAQLGVPVLFVSTQYHDVPLTLELMKRVTVPVKTRHISNREYSHYDIMGVLGRLSLLFGMRLHATILASAGLTPVLALPHQPKVSHYFRTLGIEEYALTFDEYSEENLERHLLKGWSERAKIRALLEKHIPVSRMKALQAARIVAAMSEGKDIARLISEMQRENQLAA
ncbi:MAG: polysaccharide pyruvyl transferase family protein, partial [Deltaproteobacteria bacterium]|nr:polysaccharide pyruvyl transferase family protein [Deltaproteobacteria bacterium]